MSAVSIRRAERADVPLVLRFVRELAAYEREPQAVVNSEAALAGILFGARASVHALIAEIDGEPLGFAVYFFNYSTWLGRYGLYLEDLYVTPAGRGRGAGKALLGHLARVAVDHDCGRFEWNVLDWNASAIAFYESLGARPQSGWTVYRLTGDALQALADRHATIQSEV